jgi:cytochrome P450
MKVIDKAIDQMIRARRECESSPRDLLTMLMRASYPDGSTMRDAQVRDEAITLSITGFETVGDALAWTWYLLAKHPEAEATVLAEVQRECDGRAPNVADLPRLRYTGMALSESMRLYPPTWIYVRVARQEDSLPSGAKIPAGAKLYLSQYVMHRNRRYFPDPDRFDPLRFADTTTKTRSKYAYFPFGGGPHLCIGQGLAMMEGVLVLATIASRWRLSLARNQIVTPEPGVTLYPKDGILMRCNLRSP